MAIDTNNTIAINTVPTITQVNAAVGKMLEAVRATEANTTEYSEAAEIAFTTKSTSARYIRLAQKGLNNLRSELIASCEFLPISAGASNADTAKMQFTLGDNNSITVNHISKLIELHRQIRSYILEAANQVLQRVQPQLTSQRFLNEVSIFVKRNFNANVASTIGATIANIINAIQESQNGTIAEVLEANASNAFCLAIIEYYIYEQMLENIFEFLAYAASVDSTLGQYWSLTKLSLIKQFSAESALATNDNNANKLIELYSNLSPEYSQYSKIGFSKPSDSVELLGFRQKTGDSDTDIFCNTLGALGGSLVFVDSSTVLGTLNQLPDDVASIVPGEVRLGAVGDLSKAIGRLKNISFGGMFAYLPDGVASEELTNHCMNLEYDPDRALFPDRYTAIFDTIRNSAGEKFDSLTGATELLATVCYDMYTFDVANMANRDPLKDVQSVVAARLVPKIGSFNTSGIDFWSNFSGNTTGGLSNDPNLEDVQYSVRTEDGTILSFPGQMYHSFIVKVLGIPSTHVQHVRNQSGVRTFSRVDLPNAKQDSPIGIPALERGFGLFGTEIAGIRRQLQSIDNTEASFYSPLEGGTLETTSNNSNAGETLRFTSAAEYFVKNPVLARTADESIDFSELDDYTDRYKKVSNQLFESVLTLYPHQEVTETHSATGDSTKLAPTGKTSPFFVAEAIIRALTRDLENIRNSGTSESYDNYIPLLSVFLRSSTVESQRQLCLQAFFDILQGRASFAVDLNNNFNHGDDTKKTISTINLYHLDKQVKTFFRGTCGFSFNSEGTYEYDFYNSEHVFTAYLAPTGDLFTNPDVKDKIKTRKHLNQMMPKLNSNSTGYKKIKMSARKIDNFYDNSFSPADLRVKKLSHKENVDHFQDLNFGVGKLLKNYLNTIAYGQPSDSGAAGNSLFTKFEHGISEQDMRLFFNTGLGEGGAPNAAANDKVGNVGGVIEYNIQHRIIVGFRWAYGLLKRTIGIDGQTDSAGNFTLSYNVDQIDGLLDGLLEAVGDNTKNGSKIGKSEYDIARRIGSDNGQQLLATIRTHQQFITDRAAVFAGHADSLGSVAQRATDILAGKTFEGEEDPVMSLAVNVLKDTGIYVDAITLNSKEAAAQFSAIKDRVYALDKGTLFPRSLKYSLAKNKLMSLVLSQPGYGFLTGEKYGNKTILNVGITNSMIESLQKLAYDQTGDYKFLNSPYVAVTIHKKDHFNPNLKLLPKVFVFDTSVNILDYDFNGRVASHLKNLNENSNFESILKSINVFRYRIDNDGKLIKKMTKGYPDGIFNRDVMINHVHDYCLKEYMKLTSGLDFNEETFLLLSEALDQDKINPTVLTGDALKVEYKKILARIENLYPDVQTDPQLKSELFRMTKLIKQSAPFSFGNKFKKIIAPKAFDRVYSVMINEKDFLIDIAVDGTTYSPPYGPAEVVSNIFAQQPSFSVTAKLTRPNLSNSDQSDLTNTSQTDQSDNIAKYIKSIDENFPGVYQYKAEVSLLPLGFYIRPDTNKAVEKISSNDDSDLEFQDAELVQLDPESAIKFKL